MVDRSSQAMTVARISEKPDVRYWSVFLNFLSAAAGSAASGPPNAEIVAQLERDGRSLFFACEFKRAAHVFERALSMQPNSAALYYWLGKSFVRLADVSSPLSAPKNARRARRNLKEAVKRGPRNSEYRSEVVDAAGSPVYIRRHWTHRPGAIAMSDTFRKLALLILFAGFCSGQSLTPDQAIDRYLTGSRDRQPGCSDWAFALQIDASLPKLKKQGSMSGLKVVSRTGQTVYRGLRFKGDNLVKTAVIARFLANDAKPPQRVAGTDVTRQNYSTVYDRTSRYNGLIAYVFRVKPIRKRIGLFKGELWLEATTAAPLRLWGDFVKSPSIFVRSFRFVQDYQRIGHCFETLRLLLTVETRIAGKVEMAVWLHPVNGQSAAATAGCGSSSLAIPGLGQ
jgi:tetratricopeptide (TPR) repeat protein